MPAHCPGQWCEGKDRQQLGDITAPPENSYIADADSNRTLIPQGVSPDGGSIMRPGTGGLY